ncbi:Uncharacterized protein dnl_59120 [Desulfonema limicola]|uniref:Nucleoside 2-deoxyribosyltransferase n=1 Tax=Desulfonema limicola TaxID=45656 RepID=A0A975BE96_9BACT|nr:hypothetical protein [Desulfonema limicola]QTA83500.1 Uncharacterized protein dnl_59120 [Desulfonema limicola]
MTLDDRPFVYVIMPFSSKFRNVYFSSIKTACEELNLKCERVDEQIIEGTIIDRIYRNITDADLIIAELTEHNPSVYYELGYSRALRKRIISISRDINSLPFDLSTYQALQYGNPKDPNEEVDYQALKENIKNIIEKTIQTAHYRDENIPIVYPASRLIQGGIFDELLKKSEVEIIFCGIHFQWSLSDHEEYILEKLESGVSIDYVITDPTKPSVIEKIARMLSISEENELIRECEDGFRKLERLYRQTVERGCSQNLNVFFTDREPLGRYYLFDHNHHNGSVLATPYTFELRSSHSPTYLYKARTDVARSYIKSCIKLKESSKKYQFS